MGAVEFTLILVFVIYMMSCISSSSSSVLTLWNKKKSTALNGDVTPGKWSSRMYGKVHSNSGTYMCPKGSYISDMIMFHGQKDHTNAWNGYCFNPESESITRVFTKGTTCGKRDRPDVGKGFGDALSSVATGLTKLVTFDFGGVATEAKARADAQKDILQGGFGRALWKPIHFSSPLGINAWHVVPKDDEIKGLQLYGIDGTPSGWAGGTSQSRSTASRGQCPKGKVLVGVTSGCGDRVDNIKFHCDVPSNPSGS